MAAINYKKMVFSILRSSYDEAGISEFLRNLSYGKGRVMPMAKKQMPDIATNEPWDGKDGEVSIMLREITSSLQLSYPI